MEKSAHNSAKNLLVNGLCKACSNDEVVKSTDIVQCFWCKDSFHAINCDETCNVSAPTVFTAHLSHAVNNTSSYAKRFGRFLFICNDCSTAEEEKRAATTVDRVGLLDNKIDAINLEFREEMSELKTLLKEQLSQKPERAQERSSDQVDFMKQFAEQFSSLKEDLTKNINDVIENKVNTVVTKSGTVSHTKDVLYSSLFTDSNSSTPSAQPPHVPIAPTRTQPSSPEILILSPKEEQSVNAATMTNVKKFATDKLKSSQVVFLRCNENNKKVSIGFPNAEIRDKATSLLNDGNTLDSYGYQSKNGNKMLPKVTIYGVSSEVLDDIDTTAVGNDADKLRDLEKNHLVAQIVEKNSSIKDLYEAGHTISIVYLNKIKRFTNDKQERIELTIGIKLSPSVYRVLFNQQQGSLYLGSRRYKVTDRFYIKQCYHCQMIGHTSVDCNEVKTNKHPTCMYCMGSHRSSACQFKQKKDKHACARCLASTHTNDAENSRTHNAAAYDCPVLVRETKRIAANTDFISKNVM
jgi:hypothetical protein